jgi:hypothetical protein
MKNLPAMDTRREVFIDQRGIGLRVTWHPEQDLLVLSVWDDDRCVGTFWMPAEDVPRMKALLSAALGDWIPRSGSTGPPPSPAPEAASPSITQRLGRSRAALRLRDLYHRRGTP